MTSGLNLLLRTPLIVFLVMVILASDASTVVFGEAIPYEAGQIAFQRELDGDWEIFVMNDDRSQQTRLTTSAGRDVAPSISPDGTRIVFISRRYGNDDVFVMDTSDKDGDGNGDNLMRLISDTAD